MLEIIVQDDCSPDFDIEQVLYGEPAQAARNPINLGFAGNCNAGAARSHGDVLLFLNQDTVAREHWFEPLIAMFADPRVGVVGPKLVSPAQKWKVRLDRETYKLDVSLMDEVGGVIQSCGGLYGGNRGPFHRWLGWSADDWRVNVMERVSWVTGAALAVRRDLFVQVGGFDVGYRRGYFEDVDLCEAVKALGYEVWYCPEAVFEHTTGTSGGIPPEIFKANSMRFHEKWDSKIVPDTPVIHVPY